MNFEQEVLGKYFVKVYKSKDRPDDRTLLCGSHVEEDKHGQFFVVPAHSAEYLSKIFPQYEFGKPFIPKGEVKE